MVGCFDTKEEDFEYLYGCLIKNFKVITINTGVLGTTDCFPVHFEANAVAFAADSEIFRIRDRNNRGEALELMGKGAATIVGKLFSEAKVDGIIGMGGGGGTYMALMAMCALPFGIPKLCISTLATKDLSRNIGAKDITLMPSIVDVAGLNNISRVLIAQASMAIYGMILAQVQVNKLIKGSIAISVFGNTTRCADACSTLLKSQNYDVLSFHSVGTGGMAMESLINDGVFDAVLDITTTELADELCGGICSAGPTRLTAAANRGIPQVVAPGCLDMVNFGTLNSIPEKYRNRTLFSWAPDVTLMRTNGLENKLLGEEFAKKLNNSKGPVTVLLPLGGLSKVGAMGEIFHDPELDRVLFDAIKKNLNKSIQVVEVDANIDTPFFAEEAIKALLGYIK